MKRKDFFVINSETNRILFHAPSFNFTRIDRDLDLDSLTDQDVYCMTNLDEHIVAEEKDSIYGKGKIGVTFMSSRYCNLNCKYCFAENGEYGKRDDIPKFLTSSMYMDTVKFITENMYPEGIKSISFFGGEPLLNYSQIKAFIEECEEYYRIRNCELPKFGVSTNSILLDTEMLSFFRDHNIQIGLSLDGIKTINDSARYSEKEDFSVYDTVAEKVKLLRQYNISYAFQMTINKKHLDEYEEGKFAQWMNEMDVYDCANVAIIPVTSDEKSLGITTEEDFRKLDTISREIANFYINELYNSESRKISTGIVAPMIQIAKKKVNGSCSAGHSIFIDTNGDIYPCHMFCYDSKFILGNIQDKSINYSNVDSNINTKRKEVLACQHCIAQNVCSVWCKGLQYLITGDMYNVLEERCIFQRAIVEECIKTLDKLRDDNEKYRDFANNLKRITNLVKNQVSGENYEL